MWIAIFCVLYVIIGILAYQFVFSKIDSQTKFEQIWFSVLWICVLPLYPIYWLHKKLG